MSIYFTGVGSSSNLATNPTNNNTNDDLISNSNNIEANQTINTSHNNSSILNTNSSTNNTNAQSITIQQSTTENVTANANTNNIWTDPNDDFDSDQLDEDESYSWASTDNQDVLGSNNANSNSSNGVAGCSSSIANWRDWKSNNLNDLFINNLNILSRTNTQINFLSKVPFTQTNSLNPPQPQAHFILNHLRNDNNSNLNSSSNNKINSTSQNIEKLVDLCAKYVATNLPFELVETYREPVPEDLQLKITFSSFPDNIENIRLYSCLANGNADEYLRGEQLFRNRCVRKIIQIGFHLSAQVVSAPGLGASTNANTNSNNNNINSNANTSTNNQNQINFNNYNFNKQNSNTSNNNNNNLFGNLTGLSSNYSSVAIVCDRKRIVSCSCTCSKQTISWCSHIVAVCLYRILEPLGVEFRAPVSESLSKLKRDQLQKFAQYLISELPQQVLPTAQKLLDELLKSDETSINLVSGAPDPTAGASQNDISIWCLDEYILQENIHKTLVKFIAPTPNVVSDIECLEHASSATAAEYTSLLRPLRGREPEGMWNLISIVREMFKKRDKNSMPLLRIITTECISIDQIIQLWFLVKASQLHHDKALFNSVSGNLNNHNRNSLNHNSNSSSSNSNLTTPVHQACSNLMEEIVSLWRIACLNPLLNDFEEKQLYREQLLQWHQSVFERLKKFCNFIVNNSANNNIWSPSTTSNANSQSNNLEKLLKRLDTDLFCAFLPAISACDLTWYDFELDSIELFKNQCFKFVINSDQSNTNNSLIETENNSVNNIQNEKFNKHNNDKFSLSPNSPSSNKKSSQNHDDINNLYKFDYDPSKLKSNNDSSNTKEKDILKFKFKLAGNNSINENRLSVLFSRCEALYAHGFTEYACYLAQILAEHMLKNTNSTPLIFTNNIEDKTNEPCSSSTQNTTNSPSTSQSLENSITNPVIPSTSNTHKSNNLRQKCINNFQNTVLWRSYLLCNILFESSLKFPNMDIIVDCLYKFQDQNTNYKANRLSETSKLNQLAFQIGLFGLETPRMPAISKALEVKLINQEQELVSLLKKLQIGSFELNLLRDRAVQLRDNCPNRNLHLQRTNQNYFSLPIMLASFIFDVLYNYGLNANVYDQNSSPLDDQQIAFDSSISVLGMKANISESQHPLLCEGIRRQKGDLSLNLLLTYKDDEQRLLKIMDKILDRDVHILFKQTTTINFNPFNPNFKKIQQQQLQEFIQLGLEDPLQEQINNQTSNQTQPGQNSKSNSTTTNLKYTSGRMSSAIDSLSSGWEESENESSNLSGDVSLLETKYRCLTLKQQQIQQNLSLNLPQQSINQQNNQANNSSICNSNNGSNNTNHNLQTSSTQQQSKETTSSDNSPTISNRKLIPNIVSNTNLNNNKKSKSIDDSGDDSVESSSSADNADLGETIKNNSLISQTQPTQNQTNQPVQTNVLTTTNNTSNITTNSNPPNENSNMTNFVPNKFTNRTPNQSNNFNNSKFNYNNLINQMNNSNNNRQSNQQPSEALAHFMFEFSKTVLSKAGGSVSTSVFLNHQSHQPGGGPHRNLHICSFLISLYALGLHNCVQPSWLSRTYSSHVTWVNSQAVDIGYAAICILIECWQGHLTPSECVSLADRVSRGRDNMAVKAAAELALSSLRYAHLMNLTEIQRALIQCKEQSKDMLQRACIIVENAVKDANSSNLLEILFTVAKRWDELFTESSRDVSNPNNIQQQQQQQQQQQTSNTDTNNINFFNTNQNAHLSNIGVVNFNFDQLSMMNINNNNTIRHSIQPTLNFNNSQFKNVLPPTQYANPSLPPSNSNLASNIQPITTNMNNIPINLIQQAQNTPPQFMPAIFMPQTALQASQGPNSSSSQPTQFNTSNPNTFANLNQNQSSSGSNASQQPTSSPFLQYFNTSNVNNHNNMNNSAKNINFQNQPLNSNVLNYQQNTSYPCIENSNPNLYHLINYQQQNLIQNIIRQQQMQLQPQSQNQTPPHQVQQTILAQQANSFEMIDNIAMKHLTSAFRVGMLGLEALPRRADGSHQIKYRQSPAYADDVKWLWEVAIKLDTYLKTTNSLQQFCQTASVVLQNPFLIQELVFDSANYLSRNNPAQFSLFLCSPILNVLVQRCLNLYFRCCMSKLHHLTPNEHEDFINMLLTARNIFFYSGNMNYFSDLVQNLRRSNKCKKDIWNKICNALNNQ